MTRFAPGAIRLIKVTEKRIGFTAPESAMQMPDGKRCFDLSDYRKQLISYQITMSMVRNMLSDGIISEEEYDKIDTIMAKKYGVSLFSIFR